ncbi:hypothetical protein THAOC_18253, partial [Thalassiosira oceanica]
RAGASGGAQVLPPGHPNLLELLGLKFDRRGPPDGSGGGRVDLCYFLFPLMPDTLRGELTRRNVLLERPGEGRRCFTTREVLRLLGGLIDGLSAVHGRGLSHRDLKVENILLRPGRYADREGGYVPVIMDFGSAGPRSEPLATRSDVLRAVEAASSQTTLAYRPPSCSTGASVTAPARTSSTTGPTSGDSAASSSGSCTGAARTRWTS